MAQDRQRAKVRLHVRDDLAVDGVVGLESSQAHYLRSVLRLGPGDEVALFNGRDGEWRARIDTIGKGWASLQLTEQSLPQPVEPDIWLLFAPIKRGRVDFLVQKATELGVSILLPTTTRRTVVERINLVRLGTTAAEAAEQCRRLSVPELRPVQSLEKVLASWPEERRLLFCDEAGGPPAIEAMTGQEPAPWAILIGPEGGFDPDESQALRERPFVVPMSLGPRILRAETAAVAALSLWQAVLGDGRA
ncbi:MAG: 16S rRNA (uracil(1498)-N(3))-methyltransferase [Rhodospirillaceae bacterium]|nr:16S rRNA (uracil(1498)-N(3))-methyltransferase [Rhodospirillaceae bacterium]MBT3494725.1 16S rRNA (uracil(1498)-N(3))-methyltransferase [Rhodospirillaceae bacterium]MBT3779080.1 16S rRNA (uracil(1498)-N(3))-methyltransferase [Rhodospirillaceae bacterium]MBT3976615.1 16S rRNA (uracil(1498)-N(3))-methyltransferase [Rhodospirillaceae bacterium]MBT4168720.1 16S rRNA (uracil(1498)-N(3))-methyltransferase [Rhodospirillaceae bacterium]